MLNSTHSQASNLNTKLAKKLSSVAPYLNIENSKWFELFNIRLIRWCALHAAGGGWMCDYDVVNKGFTPEIADNLEQNGTLYINDGGPAYLFYATKDHCEGVIKKLIQDDIVKGGKSINECDVIQVNTSLSLILNLVEHAHDTEDLKKSEVMQKLCNE